MWGQVLRSGSESECKIHPDHKPLLLRFECLSVTSLAENAKPFTIEGLEARQMIRNEYLRFLEALRDDGSVSEDERRIANLVGDHLDEIVPLGTAAGQRVRRIKDLALTFGFDRLSPELPSQGTEANVPETDIRSIASVTVGPFRGFRTQADFNVDSNTVLIYGPNGTGKTSFCEALEYGLLGSVQEAESKRFGGIGQYLENADAGEFVAPALMGRDSDGNVVNISPDEEAFRFCFVEKNRIDSFSRIASYLPSKQMALIASLFGLEDFNEFVRAFSESISDTYLDQTGIHRRQLEEKQNAIVADQRTIETEKGRLPKLRAQARIVAERVREGLRFSELEAVLGTDETPGLIQELEGYLTRPAETPSGIEKKGEVERLEEARKAVDKYLEDRAKYDALKDQVSYRDLYRAISQISSENGAQCPACDTPLERTVKNPFEAAEQGLQELEHLAELESQIQQEETNLTGSIRDLQKTLFVASKYLPDSEPIKEAIASIGAQPEIPWFRTYFIQNEEDQKDKAAVLYKDFDKSLSNLEKRDAVIAWHTEKRTEWEAELRRLRSIRDEMFRVKFQRKQTADTLRHARASIFAFNKDNQDLLTQVENERGQIEVNRRIAAAYSSFVARLRTYNESLPSRLVQDLGEKATDIYNAFNRGDDEFEKLASIRLPASSDERLEIAYRTEPENFKDALHVLSEGHIRCIGLAILIAKNIESNAPFLIFDDPVNAIDDDHREAIRITLFDDDVLGGKQILLTCHGDEFFKDVQNMLGAERARVARTVTFLPRSANRDIRYDDEPNPRNYVVAARRDYERNNIRDSLGHSRRALEYLLAAKLWRHVAQHGDPVLSIRLSKLGEPIGLRNLFDQLRAKVRAGNFTSPSRDRILEQLNILNGVNSEGREWGYLNKGTHEESNRAEFSRIVVGQIVEVLEALDAILH